MRTRRAQGSDVTVLILGGGKGTRLDPLTRLRAKPAVPLGGKYRLIDVPISNALNSGMNRMYVLTQYNSVSLHRHIAHSYRFDRFSGGYVQILAAQQTPGDDHWFLGTADAVRRNLQIVEESAGDLVLILSGDHMYRMDYREMVRVHRESGAQATLGVLPCNEADIAGFGAVRVDPEGRVVEFREKPKTPVELEGMEADPKLLEAAGVPADKPYVASMGIYVFDKAVLVHALKNPGTDFGAHVIPALVDTGRVQSHFFTGYWRDIGTISAFFETHMDLCLEEPPFTFQDPEWPFFSHPRYLPGARLMGCSFQDSICADGAEITRSRIERAVIGVRSIIREATIRRALIMGADYYESDGEPGRVPIGIGEGTIIENAIVDKNARIGRDCRLVNAKDLSEAEGEGWAIRDGIVVINKNAEIADGTVV